MNQIDFPDILKDYGQHHILDHYSRLAPDKQKELYDHTAGLDLDLVFKLHRDRARAGDASSLSVEIKPSLIVPIPRTPEGMGRHAAARSAGESLISADRVAALIVAGGQGVRPEVPLAAGRGLRESGVRGVRKSGGRLEALSVAAPICKAANIGLSEPPPSRSAPAIKAS